MFNTYTNSVLWPIRSKGYQDYCSLLTGRSDSYPFTQASTSSRSTCCCASSRLSCCCCATSSSSYIKPKVWINPGFVLYGLRQSALIQWPSFRRGLVVGRRGQVFDRLLGCEDNGHCCEVYPSCSRRNVDTRRNRGISLRAVEDSQECFIRSCPDDVEAMITFLSEELIDEFSCDKERNWNSSSKVEERKKGRRDSQFPGGNVRRVEVEAKVTYGNGRSTKKYQRERLERPERFFKQEYKQNETTEDVQVQEKYSCEHCGGRKKTSQLESDSHDYNLVHRSSYGKKFQQNEEREVQPRRSKSSSCSYYSLDSSGDIESDTEDQDQDLKYHRDNQRISEKKLIGDSNKRLKSRKGTSQMDSRRKRGGSASGGASNYHKQVFVEGETSNHAVTFNKRREKQFSQIGSRVSESFGNHEEDMEIQEIHVNDEEMNSQNQKLLSEREDNRVHSIISVSGGENSDSYQQQLNERLGFRYIGEERMSDMQSKSKYTSSQEGRTNVLQNFSQAIKDPKPLVEEMISNQAGMRLSTDRFSEKSEIHDMDIRNTYLTRSEDHIRNQEVRTDMVPGLQSQVEQQSYYIDQIPSQKMQSSKTGRRLSTERFSEKSETHDMDIRNTYVTQSEDSIRNQEVRADLVPALQPQAKQQGYHIDQIPLRKMEADKTHGSVSHTSDAVRFTEIKRKSEKRIIGQEIKRKAEESAPSKEGQEAALRLQSSHGKLPQEASSSQPSLYSVSQNRMQLVNLVSEEMQGSETTLIPPSSQLVSRGSGYNYETARASIQEIYHGTSESDYQTAFENPGAGSFVSSQDAGELTRLAIHEDALGSAHRLEQSSRKLIGEFVEKAKHEASTSETEDRRAESNQLKRRDSRQASDGSGAKGPSDEMWVTDSAQGTPQLGATQGSAAEGSVIVKRSGRSMWSVIADIARLRWGPRAGSPESSAKPTRKSSPNESVSSAAWFSGREHEGSSDDNTKGDGDLVLEGASPLRLEVGQTFARTQSESSGATKSNQQSGRHEGVVSLPSTTIVEGGSASNIMVCTSSDQIVGIHEECRNFQSPLPETEVPKQLPTRNLKRSPAIQEPSESSPTGVSSNQNVSVGDGRRYQARVPELVAGQMPLLLQRQNQKSPVAKEHPESLRTLVSGSDILREQVESQPPSAKSQEETCSVSRDSALTHKKFQRNKQVVRDRFEEWEDAYRVEAERRLVDETFMREALVEAKKGGDIWEVPVGAVLVHDGKIIARSFNLVEELRDSTAHAEIICIREGSKVLRSWRLADTTLYVTLEPCPMCAGAILQARVNTLVWGAPNKLLGADGSWIRLFPGGEGNGSELSDKPPPPVHPFHPKMTIRRGVLESECAETMQQFFQLRRKKKDKTPDNKNSDPRAPTDHHHHHLHPSKLLNKMHQVLPFFCL